MAEGRDADREVLTSLPRTRPARRSTKRPAAPASERTAATSSPSSKATPRAGAKGRAQAPARKPSSASGQPPPARKRPAASKPRPAPIPPAGFATPDPDREEHPPLAAVELVGTLVQAAAELAQIGASVGRQTVRSMLERLPKP